MKCEQCEKEGKTSKVVPYGSGTYTLMDWTTHWYDEDGKYHEGKDPNSYFQEYKCSNGHVFEVKLNKGNL